MMLDPWDATRPRDGRRARTAARRSVPREAASEVELRPVERCESDERRWSSARSRSRPRRRGSRRTGSRSRSASTSPGSGVIGGAHRSRIAAVGRFPEPAHGAPPRCRRCSRRRWRSVGAMSSCACRTSSPGARRQLRPAGAAVQRPVDAVPGDPGFRRPRRPSPASSVDAHVHRMSTRGPGSRIARVTDL